MPDRLISAEHPDGRTLYACVALETREREPRVSDRRLAAVLRPFAGREAALAALADAGANVAEVRDG